MVDPATKQTAATVHSSLPRAPSDASKVVSRGPGLSKAFIGQRSSFSVDCSQAGELHLNGLLLLLCHGLRKQKHIKEERKPTHFWELFTVLMALPHALQMECVLLSLSLISVFWV